LDKLISDVLRLANGEKEDPTQVGGNAKLPVGKAAPKKEPVKAPTKKPGQPEVVEEKKELSETEKEKLRVIAEEKAIFRYRVYMIKEVASMKLKDMRRQAKEVYERLEEMALYSSKVEEDAVNQLVRKNI
jgi:hypothetical protein